MASRIVEFVHDLPGGARIRVRTVQGTEHAVDMPLSGNVSELKAQLSRQTGIPATGFIVVFGDTVLEDATTLEAAHVLETVPLRLEFRNTTLASTSVSLSVSLPSGRSIRVSVPERAGPEEVKRAVQEKEPTLTAASIRLMVNQADIPPSTTACELTEEVINVVSQLPGGSS